MILVRPEWFSELEKTIIAELGTDELVWWSREVETFSNEVSDWDRKFHDVCIALIRTVVSKKEEMGEPCRDIVKLAIDTVIRHHESPSYESSAIAEFVADQVELIIDGDGYTTDWIALKTASRTTSMPSAWSLPLMAAQDVALIVPWKRVADAVIEAMKQ